MSRYSKLKILLCIKIFFGLCNAIISNKEIYDAMSLEERRSFFGTEDGSVPEFQLVELKSPSRSKRSEQDTLEINILGDWSVPTLKLVQNTLITPGLTAIWSAKTDPKAYQNVAYDPMPGIIILIDSAGKFDLFQSAENCSAVTRFWNSNGSPHYIGTIKLNYTIKSVPTPYKYAFLNDNRGKRSANAIKNEKSDLLVVFKHKEIPQEYFRRQNFGGNAANSDLHRSRRQSENVPDEVYAKLLLIPDYGTVTRFPKIEGLLRQLIAQFNVVDMIYRQLRDPEVRLNIAGIIIPQDVTATPYIAQHTAANGSINVDYEAIAARENFQNEARRFPFNTWDALIVITSYEKINSLLTVDRSHIYITDSGFVLYSNHMLARDPFAEGEDFFTFITVQGLGQIGVGCGGGTAIVKYAENMEGPHYIAHELGHLFGLRHDGEESSANCATDDGNTMVPNFGLVQKLEWSACSRNLLRTFFRSDLGNCTYSRPEPVPKLMESMPGAWLSMDGQCDNEFNDSTEYCHKDVDTCEVLGCKRQGVCAWQTHRPLEGSVYWESETSSKACINGVWTPL